MEAPSRAVVLRVPGPVGALIGEPGRSGAPPAHPRPTLPREARSPRRGRRGLTQTVLADLREHHLVAEVGFEPFKTTSGL